MGQTFVRGPVGRMLSLLVALAMALGMCPTAGIAEEALAVEPAADDALVVVEQGADEDALNEDGAGDEDALVEDGAEGEEPLAEQAVEDEALVE